MGEEPVAMLYRIIVVDEQQRTSVKQTDCQLVVLVAPCSLGQWRAPLELLEPTLNVQQVTFTQSEREPRPHGNHVLRQYFASHRIESHNER